jgi:ABC-2 type transport system permease protein
MAVRGIFASIYFGIQVETNWTKRFLYLIYLFFSPFTEILVVILLYGVLGSKFRSDIFLFALFGSLFYYMFSEVFFNTAFVIIDDREYYKMLKFIVISKTNCITYLFGRGLAKTFLCIISVIMTLLWIIPLFRVHFEINFLILLAGLLIGFVGAFGLALAFAGYYLLSIRAETSLMDVLFGGLFLVSGAIFPPNVLPKAFFIFSKYFPLTQSIELLRLSIFSRHLSVFMREYSLTHSLILTILTNFGMFVLGLFLFSYSMRSAIKKGCLDITTAF